MCKTHRAENCTWERVFTHTTSGLSFSSLVQHLGSLCGQRRKMPSLGRTSAGSQLCPWPQREHEPKCQITALLSSHIFECVLWLWSCFVLFSFFLLSIALLQHFVLKRKKKIVWFYEKYLIALFSFLNATPSCCSCARSASEKIHVPPVAICSYGLCC